MEPDVIAFDRRSATASAMASIGSKAPAFTLPACALTMSGPAWPRIAARAASGSSLPTNHSALGRSRRSRARSRAPIGRPRSAVRRFRSGRRVGPAEPGSFDIDAVRSQNMMAGCEQPDRVRRLGTRREPHGGVSGKINTSRIQRPATCSAATGAGPCSANTACWSHAETSQSAPSPAGRVPPLTRARYRPIRVPTIRAPAMWPTPRRRRRGRRPRRGGR